MIVPRVPASTIWRAAVWPHRNAPLRFTRITRSNSSSVRSRKGISAWTAALETMQSSRPKRSAVRADQPPDLTRVADVGGDGERRRAERGGLRLHLRRQPVGERDLGAFLDEPLRDGEPDPPRRSGDDGDLALEAHQRPSTKAIASTSSM